MDYIAGTCSLCGGNVMMPIAWMSTTPPVPTCRSCGATKKQGYRPVIEMEGGRERKPLAAIEDEDWDGSEAEETEIERCERETGHARVAGTYFCRCTHVMDDGEDDGDQPLTYFDLHPTARAEALSDRHERLHSRDGKVEGVDR